MQFLARVSIVALKKIRIIWESRLMHVVTVALTKLSQIFLWLTMSHIPNLMLQVAPKKKLLKVRYEERVGRPRLITTLILLISWPGNSPDFASPVWHASPSFCHHMVFQSKLPHTLNLMHSQISIILKMFSNF